MSITSPRQRIALWIACLLCVWVSGACSSPVYDCSAKGRCGLLGDGAYPHLVLGKVLDVADEQQATTIFNWAHQHGYWSKLPDDPAAFVQAIQVLSVEIPASSGLDSITLLMGRKDFDIAGIVAGDYVRFSPHPASEINLPGYINNPKDVYWEIFGCVAVLCSAGDLACMQRYRSGVYDSNGIPLEPLTGQAKQTGQWIDPLTYLPLTPEQSHKSPASFLP